MKSGSWVWVVSVPVVAAALSVGAYVAAQSGMYLELRQPGVERVSAPLAESAAASPAVTVRMTPQSYRPQYVQVRRGAAVRFVNAGSADQWPLAEDSSVSAGGIVPAGGEWVVSFPQPGVHEYVDRVYPNLTFTVEVL